MLLSICIFALSRVQAPFVTGPKAISIVSKTGSTLASPIDLGKPTFTGQPAKGPASEIYNLAPWPGCHLRLSRAPFTGEDPNDSVAVKLEDVLFNDLDLEKDRISKIEFGVLQGWPETDIEGKKGDGTLFRFRICRTKSNSYLIGVTGPTLPPDDVLRDLFGTFHVPAEVGQGKLTKWGPVAGTVAFPDAKLDIWTPIPFKDTDDYPELNDDDTTGEGHVGEFGYTQYTVGIVTMPSGMGDRMDDEVIDKLIKAKFDENDPDSKPKFGEFKSKWVGNLNFRTVTYTDSSSEGRIDVVVKDNRLYMFDAMVPRGMLDSEDVKKFFASIAIR